MQSFRAPLTKYGAIGTHSFGGPQWTGKGLSVVHNEDKLYVGDSKEKGRDGKSVKRTMLSFDAPESKKKGGDIMQEDVTGTAPASAGGAVIREKELFGRDIGSSKKKYTKVKGKDGTFTFKLK